MSLALVNQIEIHSKEDAIQLANEIERLETTLKLMKDELKQYVKDYGAVETDEKVWSYTKSFSWAFDKQGIRKIMEGMVIEGIDPYTMITVPSHNIKKLGWSDQVLAQYGKKKETSRFTSKKIK